MTAAQSKQLLSDKFAKTAAPNARHWDSKTAGFFLRTGKTAKTWALEHKGRVHNLGRYPDVSAADAREAALAIMAPSANVETSPTLEQAMEHYLDRDRLRSDHNKRAVESQMRKHMSKFLGRRLHTITKMEIEKVFKELSVQRVGKDALGRKSKLGGTRTANHTMQSFRTIWNHARKRMMEGELKACPTEALELHIETPPKDIIEDLDAWKVEVAKLDPMHRCFYRLALLTGARKTELLSLKWDQIEADRIHLPETKNDRAFDIPLEPEHIEIIDQLGVMRRAGTDYVFWSAKGDGHLKQPQKIAIDGQVVTAQMHRRTFATLGEKSGLSPWQIGQLLNHTLEGVTSKNYIRTSVDHYRPFMRQYLDALPV